MESRAFTAFRNRRDDDDHPSSCDSASHGAGRVGDSLARGMTGSLVSYRAPNQSKHDTYVFHMRSRTDSMKTAFEGRKCSRHIPAPPSRHTLADPPEVVTPERRFQSAALPSLNVSSFQQRSMPTMSLAGCGTGCRGLNPTPMRTSSVVMRRSRARRSHRPCDAANQRPHEEVRVLDDAIGLQKRCPSEKLPGGSSNSASRYRQESRGIRECRVLNQVTGPTGRGAQRQERGGLRSFRTSWWTTAPVASIERQAAKTQRPHERFHRRDTALEMMGNQRSSLSKKATNRPGTRVSSPVFLAPYAPFFPVTY